MSSENRKQNQRRRQPVNVVFAFWRSPTGWVIGGIAVSIVLAAGVGFYNSHIRDRADVLTAQPPAGAQITVVARGGTPEAENSLGAEEDGTNTPRAPSSVDPAARLPEPEAWLKNAVAAAIPDGRPIIAVVIDDVGLDRHRSRRAMALPAPVTIALMAYAGDVRDQAETARTAGHELIVHLPMEPYEKSANPGPNALLSGLSAMEFTRRLDWNLSQFSGYVGINNHMGSRLTSDPVALERVMVALKRRGLMFLDSRTSRHTQGLEVAHRFGVPAVERDVFLDHDPSRVAVRTALMRVEELAQRNGFAVAIGHPKDATLNALEQWLPDVKARGFILVPLTAVVRRVRSDG